MPPLHCARKSGGKAGVAALAVGQAEDMLSPEQVREQVPTWVLGGLVATSVMFCASLWRLVVVLRRASQSGLWSRQWQKLGLWGKRGNEYTYVASTVGDSEYDEDRVLPQRVVFHILVFLCLLVEMPVYAYHYAAATGNASNISFEATRDLYALHLTSYLLLFAAFCVIVGLWSGVALFEPSSWLQVVNQSLQVVCFAYSLVTVWAIVRCLREEKSSSVFFTSSAFIVFCSFSVAALLLLAACFLILGCMMQHRICSALGGGCGGDGSFGGGVTVFRLNAVVLVCFVCFCFKALLLVQLLQLEMQGENEVGWTTWREEVYVEWLPHLIPCAALLYLMRKTGPSSSVGGFQQHSASLTYEDVDTMG